MSKPIAYYNEIDPVAAEWLRNLIKAGHIAPGVVDERSIEDVTAYELEGFTQCHFFAGVGVWSLALRRAGWPDHRPIWTGSCPCQPFSASGKKSGFADERHLWPHWYWLIHERRPPVIAGEQVASKAAEPWLDLVQTDLEALGYAFGAVAFPSAGVGAPHIRDRTYWVGHTNHSGLERLARNGGPAGWQGSGRSVAAPGVSGRVADSHRLTGRKGSEIDGRWNSGSDEKPGPGPSSSELPDLGRLGDTTSAGPLPVTQPGVHSGQEGAGSRDVESERPSTVGRLADTSSERREWRQGPAQRRQHDREDAGRIKGDHGPFGSDQAGNGSRTAGPTNGFWRDADWLFCRDGKWRPVEPGTFPLAHGAPARVGRLRAYGNAINAEAATVFIEAVAECLSASEYRQEQQEKHKPGQINWLEEAGL